MALTQAPAELLNLDSSLTISGTTPSLTIGDAGAEDTKIVFDGNAQDFYIGLDDSADDLIIGLGSTVGTTPIISVDENKDVAIPDGSLTITTGDNNNNLVLASTDADASFGPRLKLFRNSASAADGDAIGYINFTGTNDAGTPEEVGYAAFDARIVDASDGTEDGRLEIVTLLAGVEGTSRILMDATETVFNDNSKDLDFRIESNGDDAVFFIDGGNDRVILGHNSARTNYYNGSYGAALQIETHATANRYVSIGATVNSDDANGAYLILGTTRGTAANSTTLCNNGDFFGSLSFQGGDGNQLVEGASIASQCDGAPGANDMPGSLQFRTTADGQSTVTEQMRIASTGLVSMGTTGQHGSSWTERLHVQGNNSRSNGLFITGYSGSALSGYQSGSTTGAVNFLYFINSGGTNVGSIQISNSNTATTVSYNTSSDHRLKENVTYNWDGLTKLKQLKPAQFNFKADPDTTIDGFLAHEAQTVVPEAVTGTHNETEDVSNAVLNALGNVIDEGVTEDEWKAGKEAEEGKKPKYAADTVWKAEHTKDIYQGIDQSKLVPLMVKAIQELEAKVKALEEA